MRLFLFLSFLCAVSTLAAQDQMFDICPLKVGAEIPEVSVTDQANEAHSLKSLSAEKPTVMIFYRGAWCGYCTKHLAELNDAKADIEALGYQIFGVTVDQASKLEESAKETNSEIMVYSDAKAEAIQAFGLDWKLDAELYDKYLNNYKLDLEEWSGESHHSLPVPAVFVVKDGMVQFQYVNPNYKTRLKPETLLAVLRTL